jgi:hypothetical protein
LGKKPEVPPPRNEAAAVDNDNTIANIKTRPLKIVLVSTETRTNIISRGPRVSNAQEVHFNPKTVNSTWFLITVLADTSLASPVSVSFSQFARFLSTSLDRSHVFLQALYGV